MSPDLEKLREELAALEKELETSHFGGLFDTRARDHKLRRLKKLRKQVAALEGTAAPVRKTAVPAPKAAPGPATTSAAKKPAKRTTKKPAQPAAKKRAR
jgi:hypothetical protein